MNVVAVGVDARRERPIVNRLHAVWSMGAVAGGLIGATLAAADASVTTHFVVAACIVATLNLPSIGLVHAPEAAAAPPHTRTPVRWWHSRPLLALAAMGVAVSVLEGAPLDWGTLYLTDVLDASSGVAAAATVTFTVGMVLARLGGDHLVHRFGVPTVLRFGAGAAAVALLTALIVDNVPVTLAAWFVIGAGVATSYPALYVAAGRAPGLPPGVGIGAVAGVARVGFLLGPALIGALADRYSLRTALDGAGDRRAVHRCPRRRRAPSGANDQRHGAGVTRTVTAVARGRFCRMIDGAHARDTTFAPVTVTA